MQRLGEEKVDSRQSEAGAAPTLNQPTRPAKAMS